MRKLFLYIFLVTLIVFIGCAPVSQKESFKLPDTNISHLKAYGRITVNAAYSKYWKKTNIIVDEGDMLLIIAAGNKTKAQSMGTNLLLKVGDSSPIYAAAHRLFADSLNNESL